MDRDARGLGGGRLRTIRASPPGRHHKATITSCRAPAARRARGAEREQALAGCSGGASGPCRPGLKTYRKFSGAGGSRLGTAVLRG
jgi:hypothetical protein